jgi:hypothetical protein
MQKKKIGAERRKQALDDTARILDYNREWHVTANVAE